MKKVTTIAFICLLATLLYFSLSTFFLKKANAPLTIDGSNIVLVQVHCLKQTQLVVSESGNSSIEIKPPRAYDAKILLQVSKTSDSIRIEPKQLNSSNSNTDSNKITCNQSASKLPHTINLSLPKGIELELAETNSLFTETNLTSLTILNPSEKFRFEFTSTSLLQVKLRKGSKGKISFSKANNSNFNLSGDSQLNIEASDIGNSLISQVENSKLLINANSNSLNIGIQDRARLEYTGCVNSHLTLVPRGTSKTIINAFVGGRWSGTASDKASVEWLGKSSKSCKEFQGNLEK